MHPSVPRRVAVVHPNTDLYGSDRMLLRTVGALRHAGVQVDLYVPDVGTFTTRADELGLTWRRLRFPVLRRTLLSPRGLLQLALRLVLSLPSVVRAVRRVDCVYVNTVNCGIWVLVARLARVPVVCHVRENEPQMGRLQRALLLSPLVLADAVVANSSSTRDWVVSAFPRLAARTQVVYNGLDLPELRGPRRARGEGPARLLLVGRLALRKGQDVAVRALRHVVDGGEDAVLVLVGDNYPGYESYVAELHRLVEDLGLQDRVTFAGFHRDLAPLWAQADVALVPSRLEPFGNVAVEAMAEGLPVVASSAQGLVEIIEPGRTGCLVPPGDPERLAEAVLALLRDPAEARALGARASQEVRQRFSLDRYNAEMLKVLAHAARRRPHSRPAAAA